MPQTKVVFYKEMDGTVPVVAWLDGLPPKAQTKCFAKIDRLRQEGHELRRPEADLLRDKIHELRASYQGIHYRILYFFHGNVAAVISHGIVKEDRVPPREIEHAITRRKNFESNPKAHSFEG